jgi:S-(hydroxymethyl)glutathione dehydrogenase/alcohol dehydrogenase
MLLDAAQARLELADQHAVAEDGGVILDHRAPQPDDLLVRLPAERDKIHRDVGAKRMDLGLQVGAKRADFRLQTIFDARDVGANIAQKFKNQALRLPAQPHPRFAARGKMRFSGAAVEVGGSDRLPARSMGARLIWASRSTKIAQARIKTALEVSPRSADFCAAVLICDVLLGSSMKTKAAVCRAFGAPLTVETVELAEPGAGEILVKTAACAICHSDIFYIDGAWGGELPAVYGHEAAGVVEAVGPGVKRLKPGDHVVATLIRNCGFCPACAEGAPVFCEEVFPLDRKTPLADMAGKPLAHGLRTGAFAEHIVVDQSQAVLIPKDLSLDSAALIACGVLTGFGAVVNTAGVKAGSSVVVIGCGGVGLNSIQGARLSGSAQVIAVDVEPGKLAAAREFGATHTINARSEDVRARVVELTAGRKADYVFVTVGVKGAAEQGVSLMKRNGAAVLVGMPPSDVMATIDPGLLAAYGQKILGSKMGSARPLIDVPIIVSLYREGRLKLDQLISGRYRLEAINEAVASSRSGAALRNVIVF